MIQFQIDCNKNFFYEKGFFYIFFKVKDKILRREYTGNIYGNNEIIKKNVSQSYWVNFFQILQEVKAIHFYFKWDTYTMYKKVKQSIIISNEVLTRCTCTLHSISIGLHPSCECLLKLQGQSWPNDLQGKETWMRIVNFMTPVRRGKNK